MSAYSSVYPDYMWGSPRNTSETVKTTVTEEIQVGDLVVRRTETVTTSVEIRG